MIKSCVVAYDGTDTSRTTQDPALEIGKGGIQTPRACGPLEAHGVATADVRRLSDPRGTAPLPPFVHR